MAYNSLMIRYRINRAISLVEISAGVYQQVRYDAYTNELGAVNLPKPFPQGDTQTGLHYFRGGYEWLVDDATKANLINSNVGVTESNFVASLEAPIDLAVTVIEL
jgi:hypothetical protein